MPTSVDHRYRTWDLLRRAYQDRELTDGDASGQRIDPPRKLSDRRVYFTHAPKHIALKVKDKDLRRVSHRCVCPFGIERGDS